MIVSNGMDMSVTSDRILVTLLLFFTSTLLCGQSLTLDELINFRKMEPMKLNDVLTKKNWDFSSSEKDPENGTSIITWAYGKSSYDEIAEAWLMLYSPQDDSHYSLLSYQIHDSKVYNAIKDRIDQYKMKLLESSVEENEISSTYQGQSITILITITPGETGPNSKYMIKVMTNALYEYMVLAKTMKDTEAEIKKRYYDGKYLFQSKTFSYAPICSDFALEQELYKVPPDEQVYVLEVYNKELYGNERVKVYCNGHTGYMDKTMLKDD